MDLRKCHIFGIIFTSSILATPFEAHATAWAKYKELERVNAAKITSPNDLPWVARLWWDKAHTGTAAVAAAGRSRSAQQPAVSGYAPAYPGMPTRVGPVSVQLPVPTQVAQRMTQSVHVTRPPRPMTQPLMPAASSVAQPAASTSRASLSPLELARLQAVSIFGVHFTDPEEDCKQEVYRTLLTSAVEILGSFPSRTTDFALLEQSVTRGRVGTLETPRGFKGLRDAIARELLVFSASKDARDFIEQFNAVLAVSEEEIADLHRQRFVEALGSVFRRKLGEVPFDWTNETRLGRRVLREMAKSLRNHLTDPKDAETKAGLATLLRRSDEEVEIQISSGKETKRISMLEYDAELYDEMFDATMKAYIQLGSSEARDPILSGVRHSFEAEEQSRKTGARPAPAPEKGEKAKGSQTTKTRSARDMAVEELLQGISSAEQNRTRSERQLRDALAIIYDMDIRDRQRRQIYVRGSRDLRSHGAFIGDNSIDKVKRRVQEFLGAIEEGHYKTFKEHFVTRARVRRAVEKISQQLGAPVTTPEDQQNLMTAFEICEIDITPLPQRGMRFGQRQRSQAELAKERMRDVFQRLKESDKLELAEAYLLVREEPRA